MEKKAARISGGLNSNGLKLVAIIAMTIDHLTWIVFPGYRIQPGILLLHTIGRLTAPIMWFCLAEGYHYTHSLKKYLSRLFIFALISHFAYNFAFGIPFIPFRTTIFNQTSVMWALAWGLVALAVQDSNNPDLKPWIKTAIIIIISIITFCADWSSIAVLVIIKFGTNRGDLRRQAKWMILYVAMYAAVYVLFINRTYGLLQMTVILAIPFFRLYNGERGKWKGMKWFFYLYYPLHLTLCGLLRLVLNNGGSVMIGG